LKDKVSTKVNAMPIVKLETPHFEDRGPVLIAGLAGRYTAGTLDADLWAQFSAHIAKIPGQVGRLAYGVCSDMFSGTGSFQYLSGVEVSESSALPKKFSCLQIPAQ
jgi:AraC family transcriptional regulator